MKALTIWQPWASLIACGAKQYETRSWATKYRGPIAIHAAMKDPSKLPIQVIKSVEQVAREEIAARRCPPCGAMPTGKVIATAELVDIYVIAETPGIYTDKITNAKRLIDTIAVNESTKKFFEPTEKEMALGDWRDGRYAWKLANVKILPEPIPVKGKQGLWTFEMPGAGGATA